ncbi:hypothetical protein [Neobacillus kokaensis]|uniref:DUF4394 domain-containing protein n=1 Tax=Neobacillus kokaensis TaxID=2759023 RepID=A0ABQ3NCC6_9BACI|nr:hypothetical protein [Neobacillus kokaensis]GHI01582.1 hypothetical protein AM1BK_51240 [Neobacillus kokaensis]
MGIRPMCTELFGTIANQGTLITVDTTTGAGTIIGNLGFLFAPSLAIDPTTGIMYAGQGGNNSNLYTVNPNTGAATLVGNTGLGLASIGGMDFRSDGTLFAAVNLANSFGSGADHLVIIDKNTASPTIVGPFGTCTDVTIPSTGGGFCTIEGMEAIAFNETGTLYGAVNFRTSAGMPGLYTIDTNNGTATFLTSIENPDGTVPGAGVVSLQFCNGVLFGGTATSLVDGGRLITIDPATGFWSYVGTESATGFQSLGGLAAFN